MIFFLLNFYKLFSSVCLFFFNMKLNIMKILDLYINKSVCLGGPLSFHNLELIIRLTFAGQQLRRRA